MIFLSLCGLPASGKTTLSRKLSELLGTKLYSCDDFFTINTGKPIDIIIREFHETICTDLMNGHSVVCDGTYIDERARRELLEGIESVQCKKIIVVLTTPFEECLRRNANREMRVPDVDIALMRKAMEFPTYDEGWDKIIYLNPRQACTHNCDK